MKMVFCSFFFSLLISGCSLDNDNSCSDVAYELSHDKIDVIQIDEKSPLSIFEPHQTIDTFLLGDLNGDKFEDTAIVFSPMHAYPSPDDFSGGGCEDDSCLTVVQFNFTSTKLKHPRALGFQTLFAIGDLNDDGYNEIGFIPKWFQSCWQSLYVYSFGINGWEMIGDGSVYACSDEDFSKRVIKFNSTSFGINSNTWNEDGSEMIDTLKIITL